MPGLFESTVSAICYEVARSQKTGLVRIDSPPWNDVTQFVMGQWGRMPRFLAWPLRIATLSFACGGLFTKGRFFHQLAPHRRGLIIDAWRHSSIGPRRDLMRFYRSLALLALYNREGNA
jgi:hypothetical protein